jgi:hypothetical protein
MVQIRWREKEGPTKIEPKPNWTPFTAFGSEENSSRVKRDIKLDFPTPESPSKITGKETTQDSRYDQILNSRLYFHVPLIEIQLDYTYESNLKN